MSLDEFEKYYREAMSDALNQLQRVTMLYTNLQGSVDEINTSLQKLNRATDEYIRDQRQNSEDASEPES